MGPFDAKTADEVETALRKANGFPPLGGNDVCPACHHFPFWADAAEREAVVAHLLPGERLLWYGRPEPVMTVLWIANLFLGAIGLWGLVVLIPTFPEQFRKAREFLHILFVGVGGPLGWLMGFVMVLFTIFYFIAPFFLAIPLLERKNRRNYQFRHIVTDRRAWTMRLGDKRNIIGGAAIVCGAPAVSRELFGRYSVAFLSADGKALIVPRLGVSTGFAVLSETDARAAADALSALRRRLD